MDLFKKCQDYTRVKDAKAAGLYPYFHTLNTRQDAEVIMEGKNEIMLGSNNYLGLTSHPDVIKAGMEAIRDYGSGCSGSRFLNGTLDLHVALEKELAEFLHKEDVVTLSTGFQTNLGVISAIVGRNDYVICDKENHASIYDGCRLSFGKMLRYAHSDMKELEEVLKSIPEDKGKLIVTDGVFSMGGDICKLPDIVRLAKKYGARVMVDDAHALGVLGAHGRGTAEHFGLEDDVDIIMGTFSKSLASMGGYIATTHEVAEYLRHNSRPFIFCASITPACVQTTRAALKILKEHPERVRRLNEITNYARKKLREAHVDIWDSEAPIIPIRTIDDETTFKACMMLFERGVYVNPVVSPAAPAGECIIRTSYMATLNEEQVDRAVKIIASVMKDLGLLKK